MSKKTRADRQHRRAKQHAHRQEEKLRRARRKAAKEEQRERRRERLERALTTANGIRMYQEIDNMLTTQRHVTDTTADDFSRILLLIEHLNLLLLDEHRYPIAAFIVAMGRKYPQHDTVWQSRHMVYHKAGWLVYFSARTFEHEHQLQQWMVAWLVTGDTEWIDPVFAVACDEGHPLNESANALLGWYQEQYPDCRDHLKRLRGATSKEAEDQSAAQTLAEALMESPDWGQVIRVVQEEEVFVVVTHNGTPLKGAPLLWEIKGGNELPVIHRRASKEDIAISRRQKAEMEDPV